MNQELSQAWIETQTMSRSVETVIEPIKAPFEEVLAQIIGGAVQDEFITTPKNYPRSPLRYPGGIDYG